MKNLVLSTVLLLGAGLSFLPGVQAEGVDKYPVVTDEVYAGCKTRFAQLAQQQGVSQKRTLSSLFCCPWVCR